MPATCPRLRVIAGLGATLALLVCATVATSVTRAQGTGVYVALGDSYTSAPLVPNQHGNPIDCGRSDHNYPSLVAQALDVGTFVDVSCGSAETKDMTAPQTGLPAGGTNPPQFGALRADATLVSIGIGGNDAGLVGVGEKCAQLGFTAPTGTACRDYYAPGGRDTVASKIAATAPKIAAVLHGIHQRSPQARVAIVGYPDVLPKNGGSCYPMVPLSPDDVRYIDSLIVRINAMIAAEAAANRAEFIDTYADSGGHDVCTLPPTRWFEGLAPTEPAFPLHPNGKGEASMARSATAVLSRPPRGPGGTRRTRPGSRGRCVSVRHVVIHPGGRRRIVAARVTVGGRRIAARVVRGNGVRVTFRGLPRGTFRVVLRLRLAGGRTRVVRRRFRTCGAHGHRPAGPSRHPHPGLRGKRR